jgi:hypothetical protein
MTMRLDIVTNDAGDLVRREHARDLGANVVIAIYRLAKLAQMHDLTNQAFTRQLEQTHQQIAEYGLRAGMHITILFAQRAIFVAGQLLKGSFKTYESAQELGDMLEWCGGQELSIQRDLTLGELHAFAEALSTATRGEKGRGLRLQSDKIRLRPVADAARLRGLEIENLTQEQRIVRNYASAVVIMRRFFEDLQNSRYILPRRIKRVAQNLVDLSEGSTPAFLGVTEVRNQNHDDAGRAANTTILAVAMARQLTNDRVVLAQLAMAAMMHDVGRPRAASLGGTGGARISGVIARISEEAEDKLAPGTAAVLTALGRVNEPTITRTVIAFEALWLRRQQWIGPVYRGARPPTLQSKILAIARRYNDLLTPEPGLMPPPTDFAIATLNEELTDPADKTVLRLLVSALGLFPLGTAVQLSTGEVGEIIAPGDRSAPDRPLLRLVMDAHGAVYQQQIEFDLATDPSRRIVRVVNVDGWSKGLALGGKGNGEDGHGADDEFAEPEPEPQAQGRDISSGSVPSIDSIKSISSASRKAPPVGNDDAGPTGVIEVGRASYASVGTGTSPSMVAEAMGRVMHSAPAMPSPIDQHQRTVVGKSPLEDAERKRGETGRHRGAMINGSWMPESVRVPMDRAPTARGTLASTPIVHTLVYMCDHALSGSVLLRETDGTQHVIYFQEGAPAKVRTGRPVAMLGGELVAAQLILPEIVPQAVDAARKLGTLFGEYLVGEGHLSRDQLTNALQMQVVSKVAALVNLPPETDYAFYQDLNMLETWAGGELTPCYPLNAILASSRAWHDLARIRATLGRIAKQPLSLHPQADLSPVWLTAEESAVIDAIRTARSTITTLYQQQIADEDTVSSLVYMLAVTRCFAFTASRGAPMGAIALSPLTSLPPPMPPSAPPESGIPVAPPPPVVQQAPVSARAPFALAQPDTVPLSVRGGRPPPSAPGPVPTWRPPPGAAAVQPQGPPQDEDIDVSATVPPPSAAAAGDDDGTSEAEIALQAMTDFRLAETALQRNDVEKAERLARKAVAAEPSNGEYVALLAWIGSLGGSSQAVLDGIEKLGQVLKDDALCERALLYRGKLLKRANRTAEALRDFQTVLDVNPRSSEAASEARLLRMQKKKK